MLSSTGWRDVCQLTTELYALDDTLRVLSSTGNKQGFSGRVPSSIAYGGLCDTMSSSMAREGARRLGAAKYPSTACDDDGDSSSMDERRLFLLCVFKHLSFRT